MKAKLFFTFLNFTALSSVKFISTSVVKKERVSHNLNLYITSFKERLFDEFDMLFRIAHSSDRNSTQSLSECSVR